MHRQVNNYNVRTIKKIWFRPKRCIRIHNEARSGFGSLSLFQIYV